MTSTTKDNSSLTSADIDLSDALSSMITLSVRNFDGHLAVEWMGRHWTRSLHLSVYYVFLIFLGQKWMKNRDKFDLRIPLIFWNIFLALFSIVGFLNVFPALISILHQKGFINSICVFGFRTGRSGYWSWLFALSKVLEFGDTGFIILRKQKLIFLHWYHHVTVLVFTWQSIADLNPPGKWFVVMNYAVHSLMYSYYALRALGFRMPRFVPMAVTYMQLLQMLVGTYINLVVFSIKRRNEPCDQSDFSLFMAFLLYGSYFLLFAHFFVKSYYCSGGKFKSEKKEQ